MDKIVCNPREIRDQLSRTEGQVMGIGKMIESNRSCAEVLQQVVAARASLQKLGVMLLETEAAGCFTSSTEAGAKVRELEAVVAQLFKIT